MKLVFNTPYWIRWSLFNLLLVASLGLLMRLKVVFELPWLNQKHLQLGHGQFAFQAWVSQLLLVLLIGSISAHLNPMKLKNINRLLAWHQGLNVAILLFTLGFGMGMTSFLLPLLIYGLQAALLYQVLPVFRVHAQRAGKWLAWAIVFLLLSWMASLGLGATFGLGQITVDSYLGWHYSHLHFQYNGWFWFASIALIIRQLESKEYLISNEDRIRMMMVFATFLALFLSLLWLNLPPVLEILAGIAAVVQLIAWLLFVRNAAKPIFKIEAVQGYNWLLVLVAIAVSLKQFMQPALLHDTLAAWAYGFRPVIIAYLHLVLLGVFSLFLLFYSHAFYSSGAMRSRMNALKLFAAAVILNELVLAWQGAAAIEYLLVPGIDWALLAAACLLALGALWLWLSSRAPSSAP